MGVLLLVTGCVVALFVIEVLEGKPASWVIFAKTLYGVCTALLQHEESELSTAEWHTAPRRILHLGLLLLALILIM